MENGTCYDPYRSDFAGGGTVFSRVWSGVRSDGAVAAPESIVIEITDISPSMIPDFAGTLGENTGTPLSEFGGPITGDVQFSCMDDTGEKNQSSSQGPDLTGDFGRKTGTPLSGFGKPITNDRQFLCMDAPTPDDAGIGNQSYTNIPDLASDPD